MKNLMMFGAAALLAWAGAAAGDAPATATTTARALPGQGADRLVDGKVNPACALLWEKKPIEVTVDFGAAREVGGVRLVSGRSFTNRGVRKASFYADGRALAEHVELRPSHTYKDNVVTWAPVTARRVKMVVEGTYDQADHYYCGYMFEAQKYIQQLFETPAYKIRADGPQTVQIAELAFFGKTPPPDLPLPNKDGTLAYPDARLVRDWQLQDAAVSNVSHCANVEADTTKPDPLGRDLDLRLAADGSFAAPDPAWRAFSRAARSSRRSVRGATSSST